MTDNTKKGSMYIFRERHSREDEYVTNNLENGFNEWRRPYKIGKADDVDARRDQWQEQNPYTVVTKHRIDFEIPQDSDLTVTKIENNVHTFLKQGHRNITHYNNPNYKQDTREWYEADSINDVIDAISHVTDLECFVEEVPYYSNNPKYKKDPNNK